MYSTNYWVIRDFEVHSNQCLWHESFRARGHLDKIVLAAEKQKAWQNTFFLDYFLYFFCKPARFFSQKKTLRKSYAPVWLVESCCTIGRGSRWNFSDESRSWSTTIILESTTFVPKKCLSPQSLNFKNKRKSLEISEKLCIFN